MITYVMVFADLNIFLLNLSLFHTVDLSNMNQSTIQDQFDMANFSINSNCILLILFFKALLGLLCIFKQSYMNVYIPYRFPTISRSVTVISFLEVNDKYLTWEMALSKSLGYFLFIQIQMAYIVFGHLPL